MRLYAFEAIDERLKLVPLAARRALDRARLKVPLRTWQQLDLALRAQLVELGSQSEVFEEKTRALLNSQLVDLEACDAFSEPPADRVPEAVRQALGGEERLSDEAWSQLSAVDRYALAKVVSRGKPERIVAAASEILGPTSPLTHVDQEGHARMVDVAQKAPTARAASASSKVSMGEQAFHALVSKTAPKGEVLATARLAGIMAAKRTSELIPLCHPLSLTRSEVSLSLDPELREVHIVATVEAIDRTGVEMEALTAASVAALTVYDMLKALDRSMSLGPTVLLAKSGGKSGDFKR